MKYTIEQLSYIVSAISFGFLFIITSINIYFKIRYRIHEIDKILFIVNQIYNQIDFILLCK